MGCASSHSVLKYTSVPRFYPLLSYPPRWLSLCLFLPLACIYPPSLVPVVCTYTHKARTLMLDTKHRRRTSVETHTTRQHLSKD